MFVLTVDFSLFMRSTFPYEPDPRLKGLSIYGGRNKGSESKGVGPLDAPYTMADDMRDRRWTLQDFITLEVRGIISSIAQPTVKAHNSELKPALISMFQ